LIGSEEFIKIHL